VGLAPTLNSGVVGLTHLGMIMVFLMLAAYFNAVALRGSRMMRLAEP
jgi:hypothetical protein